MHLKFDSLPKAEKRYMIERFGLPKMEEDVLMLKYVHGMSYQRIASELHISEKSVGAELTKARKHIVSVSKELYPIADDRMKLLIDAVGWLELDWPVILNRNR